MAKRLKLYGIVIAVTTVFSGFLAIAWAMPEFMLLASPGIVFGLMAAGNTPVDNRGLIFLGNWVFYSLAIGIFVELVLMFRKRRTR